MNTLTTVHNNGIVNQVQIVNDIDDQENSTQSQVIWNGQIHCTIVGLNTDPSIYNTLKPWPIKDFRAVYLNGIMVVKNGKVWPRRWWFLGR